MKKLLFVALVALMGLNANAQLVRSRSFQKSDARVTWFVRGGLSLNNINGDLVKYYKDDAKRSGEKFSTGYNMGFDISGGFERFFGKKNLYWGAELGIGTRGYKRSLSWYDRSDENKEEEKASMNAINVKLPIFLGYCFPINEDIKIDAHVGPYVSFDFTGKEKWTDADGEKSSYDLGELEDDMDYQRLDVGAAAGIGVWYDRFLLDVTYQRGFFNMMGESYDDKYGQSSGIVVRLGVAF